MWLSAFGSLYLTFLVPSQYTRRGSLTGIKKRLGPVVYNLLCYIIPILSIVTLLCLQVHQSRQMSLTLSSMVRLNSTLTLLSEQWPMQNNTVSQDQLSTLLDQTLEVADVKRRWKHTWISELAVWSLWTLLGMIIVVPLGLKLVMSTHRRIRHMAVSQQLQATLAFSSGDLDVNATNSDLLKSPSDVYAQSVISPSPSIQDLKQFHSSITTSKSKFSGNISESPVESTSTSAPQTPTARDLYQPFFSFPSSSSLNGYQPHTLAGGTMPSTPRYNSGSRQSLHVARRISSYAIFPGRMVDTNQGGRSDIELLNKRYWHVAAQYITVLAVMACICAFAVFEASSVDRILTE